jgi:hypothetical protein
MEEITVSILQEGQEVSFMLTEINGNDFIISKTNDTPPVITKIDSSNMQDITDRIIALCQVSRKALVLGEPI